MNEYWCACGPVPVRRARTSAGHESAADHVSPRWGWLCRVESKKAERSTSPLNVLEDPMSNDPSNELARAINTLRDRRTVLRGAAVAGLAGTGLPLLAPCAGDTDSV